MAIQPTLNQDAARVPAAQNANPQGINAVGVIGLTWLICDLLNVYIEAVSKRPSCSRWNEGRITAKNSMKKAKNFAYLAQRQYLDRAELTCNSHQYLQTKKNASSTAEVQLYCKGENYLKDNIPTIWTIPESQIKNTCGDLSSRKKNLDKEVASQLSCLARRSLKAQTRFEKRKLNFNKVIAEKPFLCQKRNKHTSHHLR